MTGTTLHWVEASWPGKLALAARPRGGDWLAGEIESWKRSGITNVVSLLTPEEEQDLDLVEEGAEAKAQGLDFLSFPILDRQIPASGNDVVKLTDHLDRELTTGRNVVLHCRQGVGRTGLIAACLLLVKGRSAQAAVEELSAARGIPIPETPEQRSWIDRFARNLVHA